MSQVQASFDRLVKLKVIPTSLSVGPDGSVDLDQDLNQMTVFPSRFDDGSPGFRIRARVDKVAAVTSPTPNPITIYIYNLGQDSRSLVSNLGNKIILEAGYGKQSQQIFTGNVMWGRTRKEGPLYVTEIQAMDGLFAFQNSRVDISFQKGITANQVINTLVGALSGSGVMKGQISGVPTSVYNQGIVLSGSTVQRLKEVCDRSNLQFSIQDGNVLILPYGSDRGTPAELISPDTGLVGIPEIRAADIQAANLISFKCLLRPSLGIFEKLIIESKFVNGIYTTAKITHDIDSWEGPFYTEVECA